MFFGARQSINRERLLRENTMKTLKKLYPHQYVLLLFKHINPELNQCAPGWLLGSCYIIFLRGFSRR
jgi:hypothetical protein